MLRQEAGQVRETKGLESGDDGSVASGNLSS